MIRFILLIVLLSACTPILSTQSSLQQPTYMIYRVQQGDTLPLLANRFGIEQHGIARLNRLRPPYSLYVNQILYIPLYTRMYQKMAFRRNNCDPMPDWLWPTHGRVERAISQTGKSSGINIFGQLGQDIRAAAAGTVIFSEVLKGYKKLIIIQHHKNLLSIYGYNQHLRVRKGQGVQAGQKIAEMGLDTRQRPAVYFEIRCYNKAVEPLIYLPK